MTEYIIIVALIAIASIGVFNLFGKTSRHQVAAMANGLAGKEAEAIREMGQARKTSGDAKSDANNPRGLATFGQSTGDK